MKELNICCAPFLKKSGAQEEAFSFKNNINNLKDGDVKREKVYYVSPHGDDSNDGLSPETAIKTAELVNKLPIGSGCAVLFERSGKYRLKEPIILRGGVFYGAYGKGEKPELLGSGEDYADASKWKEHKPDIWALELSCSRVGLINFDNDNYIGVLKKSFNEVLNNGDFYHDNEKGILYLKLSEGNPGVVFNNIEIGTLPFIFQGFNVNDVHIENLSVKYPSVHAMSFGNNKDITVSGCEIGWVGGSFFAGSEIRYGNAIEFWLYATNVSVKNCYIYQIFDAALTFQGYDENNGTAVFENIVFENNLIEYCCMNFEYWAGQPNNPNGIIRNIGFRNNILKGAGYGWGGKQRPDKEDQAFILGWDRSYKPDEMSEFYISGNIFDCADCNIIYAIPPSQQAGLYIENNRYYQRENNTAVIRSLNLYANNQNELEQAVKSFDSNPDIIKWLND